MPFTSPDQDALDAINESMERQCHLAKEYAAVLNRVDGDKELLKLLWEARSGERELCRRLERVLADACKHSTSLKEPS